MALGFPFLEACSPSRLLRASACKRGEICAINEGAINVLSWVVYVGRSVAGDDSSPAGVVYTRRGKWWSRNMPELHSL